MSVTIGSKDHTVKTDESVGINAELDAQTVLLNTIMQSNDNLITIQEELEKQTKLLIQIYST